MFEGAYQQMTIFQSIGQRLNDASFVKIPFLMKCSHCAAGLGVGLYSCQQRSTASMSYPAYLAATLMVALLRRFPFFVRKNSTPATTAFLGVFGDVAEGSVDFSILLDLSFSFAVQGSPVTLMSLLPSSFIVNRTPSITSSLLTPGVLKWCANLLFSCRFCKSCCCCCGVPLVAVGVGGAETGVAFTRVRF